MRHRDEKDLNVLQRVRVRRGFANETLNGLLCVMRRWRRLDPAIASAISRCGSLAFLGVGAASIVVIGIRTLTERS
jgi:hypothetical protein